MDNQNNNNNNLYALFKQNNWDTKLESYTGAI